MTEVNCLCIPNGLKRERECLKQLSQIIYAQVSPLRIENIDLTPSHAYTVQVNFSHLTDSQIQTTCTSSLPKQHANSIQFQQKCRLWIFQTMSECMVGYIFCNLQKSLDIFGNVLILLEIFDHLQQRSEIVGTFSEIQVLENWRRKSHSFDSGKVGRYTIFRLLLLINKFSI